MPACDISQLEKLQSIIESCSERLPPIKGCIQASMVMEESIFENTSLESWQAVTSPKVHGSWNLHAVLPQKMDFFILFSSAVGILGSASLGAYSAGNTFQDSLARYRLMNGQHAVSLDIGGVSDDGYIAKSKQHKNAFFERNPHLTPMTTTDIMALLDMYCDPRGHVASQSRPHQAIIGIDPQVLRDRHYINPTVSEPFWGHVHHIPLSQGERDAGDQLDNGKGNDSDATTIHQFGKLVNTGMHEEATRFAVSVLTSRIARLLGMERSHVNPDTPINDMGVDSLLGIELRNWVRAAFEIKLPILEISSGISVAKLGMNITRTAAQKMELS